MRVITQLRFWSEGARTILNGLWKRLGWRYEHSMVTALVTGATGFVGGHLCRELLASGYQVRTIIRRPETQKKLEGLPIEFYPGDLCDAHSLERACEGVDLVFHLGALYREAKFEDKVYWDVNFEGTRRVLEAAKKQGVKRVLHCSTTGVMGSIKNPPASEDHPYDPGDVYQESKTEAEKLVLSWFREGKIDGCIIRPTMIWGPGDTRLFKLYKGVSSRTLPIIGDGKTLNHYVLVEDLARAFRLAAESPASSKNIYLIGGEKIVTLQYAMETIAKYFGVSLFPFKIPVTPILVAGAVVEALCKPFGIEPPLHRRRVEFFVKSRAFDCSRAARDFGYKPRFHFEEEVNYIADWYVENQWLPLIKHSFSTR